MSHKIPSTWLLRSLTAEQEGLKHGLVHTLKLNPIIANLLLQRNLSEEREIRRFLNGTLSDIPNPFLLPDMDQAVDRLITAISRREKILFFGDYDVDGITGTAQFQAFFRDLEFPAQPLLPHRMHEGYGLNEKSVQKIIAQSPNLLVTIDNGTTSQKEIAFLREKGIEVIVIDHHETPSEKSHPPSLALINPKSPHSKLGDRNIASAGLVFLTLMALRSRLRERGVTLLPNLKRYLDLAALGTIADIVPLTGTNRLLVKFGLEELGMTSRPGIRALMNVSAVQPPLSTYSVSFRLAPRINAAGRLDDPRLALDLLLSQNIEEAQAMALRLNDLNQERQRIEESALNEAIELIEKHQMDRKGIAVASPNWHLGIVGIVASRLTERFHRPAVVLSVSPDGKEAKGSARTISGLSIYQVLKNIADEMTRFGGHDAAAGMSVAGDRVEIFAEKFDQAVRAVWKGDPTSILHIDAKLGLQEINEKFLEDLQKMAPHGPGNPQPVFFAPEVNLKGCRIVGERHLKMNLLQNRHQVQAIGFDWGHYLETALKSEFHHVAFSPEFNDWNGQVSIQLKIKSIIPIS